MKLIDKLFPPRPKCVICGRSAAAEKMHTVHKSLAVCNHCYSEEIYRCRDQCFEGKGSVRLVISPYAYTGEIKEAIRRCKFSGQRLYGELFGKMLASEIANPELFSEYDMLVPVPLHEKRLAERGFNQSRPLAEALSRRLNIPVRGDVLVRTRETRRQSSLKGRDRAENVKGAFLANMLEVRGRKIILVDDIYTMGETAKACAEALKEAGAYEISAITLCKTLSIEKTEK